MNDRPLDGRLLLCLDELEQLPGKLLATSGQEHARHAGAANDYCREITYRAHLLSTDVTRRIACAFQAAADAISYQRDFTTEIDSAKTWIQRRKALLEGKTLPEAEAA